MGGRGRDGAHLAEGGEVGVGEERGMADELVDDVGLGGVEGAGRVADVLGAAEGANVSFEV